MLKRTSISLLFLFALFSFLPQTTFAATSVTGHKIIIDAGHGGDDSGSTACSGLPEKDVNMQIANNSGGEVLVSIHLNGSTNPLTDGTQGLYGKIGKDKSFTQVMHNALWSGLSATPNFTNFGVTNFAAGLLLKTPMPATIQETVFISSTQECQQLSDGTGIRQQQIAQALYNGLIDW